MTYRKYFKSHSDFQFDQGLFNQIGFTANAAFIKSYLDLRQNEGKLYSDEIVLNLPAIPSGHSASREWAIRKRSTNRLIKNLKTERLARISEIGCGNGWMSNYISKSLPFDFCGIDINPVELRQGASAFVENERLNFVCADIFSPSFESFQADIFILASSIQYFPDPQALLQRLLALLRPKGEIHVLDSPFYSEEDLDKARDRSVKYLESRGQSIIQNYYFHHTWKSIQYFRYELLYDPSLLFNRLRRLLITDSPFPWIRITAH